MKRIFALMLLLALCAGQVAFAETDDNPFWGRYTYETAYVTGLVSMSFDEISAARNGDGVALSPDAITFYDNETGEEDYSIPGPAYTVQQLDDASRTAVFDALQIDDPSLLMAYDAMLTYNSMGASGYEIFFAKDGALWQFTIGDSTSEGKDVIWYVFRLVPAEAEGDNPF